MKRFTILFLLLILMLFLSAPTFACDYSAAAFGCAPAQAFAVQAQVYSQPMLVQQAVVQRQVVQQVQYAPVVQQAVVQRQVFAAPAYAPVMRSFSTGVIQQSTVERRGFFGRLRSRQTTTFFGR